MAFLGTTAGAAGSRIADGLSIAIAPEGTRSRSGAVGDFKTGAFHMAQQAGVPVVPVVIRGSGALMPRFPPGAPGRRPRRRPPGRRRLQLGGFRVRAGVDAVRRCFVDTLDHWPE